MTFFSKITTPYPAISLIYLLMHQQLSWTPKSKTLILKITKKNMKKKMSHINILHQKS
jgi:hypothetical protein